MAVKYYLDDSITKPVQTDCKVMVNQPLQADLFTVPIEAVHNVAEKTIFLKWGVLSRGKFHCLDCAHSWKADVNKQACAKFLKCAACNGKLKIHENQVHFKEIECWAILETAGAYQVVRIICSHKHMKKNFPSTYFHKEVMQHWIKSKGEVRTMSLSTNVFSQAYDQWKYYSPLEIRPKNFQKSPKYQINPYKVFPRIKVLPVIKRNGFKTRFYNIPPQLLFTALLSDPCAETLLKAKQTNLLSYYFQSSKQHVETIEVSFSKMEIVQCRGLKTKTQNIIKLSSILCKKIYIKYIHVCKYKLEKA